MKQKEKRRRSGDVCEVVERGVAIWADLTEHGPLTFIGELPIGECFVYLERIRNKSYNKVYYKILTSHGITFVYEYHFTYRSQKL